MLHQHHKTIFNTQLNLNLARLAERKTFRFLHRFSFNILLTTTQCHESSHHPEPTTLITMLSAVTETMKNKQDR